MRVTPSPDAPRSRDASDSASPKSKTAGPKESTTSPGREGSTDAEVTLSTKAPAIKPEQAPLKKTGLLHEKHVKSSDPELDQAEILMEHVNSGKLSEPEKQKALDRIAQVLKKYGQA